MMPRNIIDKYGNIADQSRMMQQKSNVMEEKSDEASEKCGIPSYAGITDSTRIRKPPGGDTHDIFGMEDRQRVQAHVQKFRENDVWNNTQIPKRNIDISADQENKCTKDASDFSSLLDQLNLSKPFKSTSSQPDKENNSMFSNKAYKVGGKLTNQLSGNNLKPVEDEVEEEGSTKKYLRRNPITGEVIEVAVAFRSKLGDCSNLVPNQDQAQMSKGFEAQRTSVRVRQPPGGASSNIF